MGCLLNLIIYPLSEHRKQVKGVKGGACQRSQHGGMGASLEGTEKELGFWSQCRLKYHLIPILAV